MPIPSFASIMEVVEQVDKCARVLQRTDDLVGELASPAHTIDQTIGPDDTDDEDTRKEDDAP